jgi:hypothetical protein
VNAGQARKVVLMSCVIAAPPAMLALRDHTDPTRPWMH